ncbi:MAG: hypothetical protein ACRDZQ_15255, partial [Acidimicrobiales bacterium]
MAPRPEVVEFRPPEVEVVLARMQELDRAHAGWLNLQPAVHAVQDLHQRRSALSWLFSVPGPGPELTLGTWTAGPVRHRGPEPPSVGIQHGRQDRARV